MDDIQPEDLKRFLLFAGVEANILANLAARATVQFESDDQTVANQNTLDTKVRLLKRGICQIFYKDKMGQRRHQAFRSPGSQLGLSAVLSGKPYYATNITLTHCEFIQIDRQHMLDAMMFSQRLVENSFAEITDRYHAYMQRQQWVSDQAKLPLTRKDTSSEVGDTRASRSATGGQAKPLTQKRLPAVGTLEALGAYLIEWDIVREANEENENRIRLPDSKFLLREGLSLDQILLAGYLDMRVEDVNRSLRILEARDFIERHRGKPQTLIRIDRKGLRTNICPDLQFLGLKPEGLLPQTSEGHASAGPG